MTFDQLTIIARDILAHESAAVALLEGTDTDHVLATVAFLDDCREAREAIYQHPAWKAA
jgi:hypothetical protein